MTADHRHELAVSRLAPGLAAPEPRSALDGVPWAGTPGVEAVRLNQCLAHQVVHLSSSPGRRPDPRRWRTASRGRCRAGIVWFISCVHDAGSPPKGLGEEMEKSWRDPAWRPACRWLCR